MNNTINSDLIRGNIDTIILRALYGGDRYGYDIINEIEQRSSGKYKLKQPTLYSCLNRLESQGFIRSYWGTKSIGGRRKYYTLTDMGKEIFMRNKTDWEYSKTLIDNLITDNLEEPLFTHANSGIDFPEDENTQNAYIDDGEDTAFMSEEESSFEDSGEELGAEESTYEDSVEELSAGESTYEGSLENDIYNAVREYGEDDEPAYVIDEDDEEIVISRENDSFAKLIEEDVLYSDNIGCTEQTDYKQIDPVIAEPDSNNSPDSESVAVDMSLFELDEREYTRVVEGLLRGSDFNNYTNKLEYEKYTPDKNIYKEEQVKAENYFQDFKFDGEDEDGGDDEEEDKSKFFPDESVRSNSWERIEPVFPSEFRQNEFSLTTEVYNDKYNQSASKIYNDAYIQNTTVQHKEVKQEKAVSPLDKFLSYKTHKPKPVVTSEQAERGPTPDLYKLFEEKMAGVKKSPDSDPNAQEPHINKELYKFFEEKIANAKKPPELQVQAVNAYVAPISEEQIATKEKPEFFRKDQIQIRNFKRLQDSAADMGDEIKIRSYEDVSAKKFTEQYYYYSNKLKLKQYFILFCIILAEVVFCYLFTNLGLLKTAFIAQTDLVIYVMCIFIGILFPLIAFALNWVNPNKRKRIGHNFKMQMLFSVIVSIQIVLIVYLLNLASGMAITTDSEHYTSLIMPSIMALNLPINTLIFNKLFNSKKYSV